MFFQSSFSDFERECYGPFLKFFPCSVAASPVNVSRAIFARNFIFLQEIGSFTKVFGFWGGNFWTLSKKFQKGCKKNPFMSQEEHCEWIFFPKYFMSILLFGHWEKNSRLPSKRFQEGYRNKCRRLQVKQIERKKLCLIFFSEFREKHWNFGDSFSAVLS